MAMQTINGFLVAYQTQWMTEPTYHFHTSKPVGEYMTDFVVIRDHSFEIEVPDKFDIAPGKIANLEELKNIEKKKFTDRVIQINDAISKLQCLEHKPTGA